MLSGEKKIGIQSLSRAQPSLPMTADAPGQSSASPLLECPLPAITCRSRSPIERQEQTGCCRSGSEGERQLLPKSVIRRQCSRPAAVPRKQPVIGGRADNTDRRATGYRPEAASSSLERGLPTLRRHSLPRVGLREAVAGTGVEPLPPTDSLKHRRRSARGRPKGQVPAAAGVRPPTRCCRELSYRNPMPRCGRRQLWPAPGRSRSCCRGRVPPGPWRTC